MDFPRHQSVPPLIPRKPPVVLSKHLSQPTLGMKNRRVNELHHPRGSSFPQDNITTTQEANCEHPDPCKHWRTLSLPQRKSKSGSEWLLPSLGQKSKSLNTCTDQSPVVISSHLSLPVKLAKLSIVATSGPTSDACTGNNSVLDTAATTVKILINDETEPRKDIDAMPRRPLKRKSQEHDRNFLSESGCSGGPSTNSDFWLPKVKVTPSMVTRLNAEILANFHEAITYGSKASEEKERNTRIRGFLQQFFTNNGFFDDGETITDAVETLSTRVLIPGDDELWTVLTTKNIINIKFIFPEIWDFSRADLISKVQMLGTFPLVHIRRILTEPDLSLAYLEGPDIEIVTGDSAKTEKLISSILVATLRAQKTQNSMFIHNNTWSESMDVDQVISGANMVVSSPPKQLLLPSNQNTRLLSPPDFLEVKYCKAMEVPCIRDIFKLQFPLEKQILHTSAVVVRFEELSSEIQVPVRIQVAAESNDFRSAILKLAGCTLTFCNPVRPFFSFNPGSSLTNIDVTNSEKFSISRIESPKPHSLLMIHGEKYYILETGSAEAADGIFQKIQVMQRNSIGKQIAHVFVTGQSLLALRIHSFEIIFQLPVLSIINVDQPNGQENTCILELDSTEALDFISTDNQGWSLTFSSAAAKQKFLTCIYRLLPALMDANRESPHSR